MAGKPSESTVKALRLMLDKPGLSVYGAAPRAGVAAMTLYRSRLYKKLLAGDLDTLRAELDELEKYHAAQKKKAKAATRNPRVSRVALT